MDLFRFLFLVMTVRYFRGIAKADTRLWFAFAGPFLVAGGVYLMLTRGAPALGVSLFIAGSAIMRIQAAMVERSPWKSLRNGALLIVAFMIFFAVVLREYVSSGTGLVIAACLFVLHHQHEQFLAERGLVRDGRTSFADQMRSETPHG